MREIVKIELYFSVNETQNITIDQLLESELLGKYKKSILFGIFIVRYKSQKLEVHEAFTKVVERIVMCIPQMIKEEIFCMCFYSEFSTGCYLCIYSSLPNNVIKLAYIDSSIKSEERVGSNIGTDEMKEWFIKFINDEKHILYTKKKVLRDKHLKESFSGYFESEVVLPYKVFFYSFFDQVKNYWRILKEADFISESWEILEEAQRAVDSIRIGLERSKSD